MQRPRPLILTALVAFALALAAPAQAEVIQWGYSTTLGGAGALPTAGTSPLNISADSPATGTVQLTGESNPSVTTTTAGTDFNPISIKILNASAGTNNLTTNGAYSLFVNLTDTATGAAGTLTFTGKLGGSFTATSAGMITNTINDPSTQSITLGSHLYTVTIGGYVPPSPPGALTQGVIGGHISVSDVPEPTSLLLGSLGVLGGTVLGLRRRTRREAASN
jgi:hypothetical protein